ncbi:type VI secretion lipoprotein TssJ [Cupriavidus sp. D39]|uniref:type VI secretion lipoprotein TssJ n=1 Tax=Cupriavidus sp. D39 TaxID=2997877 RepID=UPI00226F62DC|nr:type VI secretion lipoprotein TssJ [Cupriavidus sp. D39]MCY0858675.1 type VI secretion lipoprotein TssJ [Cupriavidus sp. D39]
MIFFLKKLIRLLAVIGIVGCSSLPIPGMVEPAVPPPDWSYAREAVGVNIEASSRLNEVGAHPHTLTVVIFQVGSAGAFSGLFVTPDGAAHLLETGQAGLGVLAADRIPVEPGTRTRIVLDRTEGAKYIGVLAGYFGMSPESARLFQIPLWVHTEGLIQRTTRSGPEAVSLRIVLGRTGIEGATLAKRETDHWPDGRSVLSASEGLRPAGLAGEGERFLLQRLGHLHTRRPIHCSICPL